MIKSARQRLGSKSSLTRQLVYSLLVIFAIAGFSTLLIKQGLIRWPLKVATGPAINGGPDFLNTITKVFAEERPMVQLKRLRKESFAASAKAMEDGEADLAIVYSNVAMPSNGLTIAIFRRDNLVLIVPGNSRLDSFQGLAGKTLGLLKTDSPERNESLLRLLDSVLAFYNISPGKVQREFLSADEIGPAIARNQIAGLLALGPAGPGPISKAISTIGNVTRTSPKLIGDKQALAIAKTIPGTEPTEIDEGAFGGARPKPDEALKTLAVTMRLVGRHSLPDFATGEIARLLTLAKARLIATSPLARDIEAPDSDDGSGLPIHPGAAAYFEGEQDSLLDSAFSIFYLISLLLGVVGSGVVWLFSAGKKGAPMGRQFDANRLLHILREARSANLASLDRLDAEIDAAAVQLLGQRKPADIALVHTIAIVMEQLDKRRTALRSDR